MVSNLGKHIGITFHRYINGDKRKINFIVNGIKCEAFDPFFKEKSTPLPIELIKNQLISCEIRGFTYPNKNKMYWERMGIIMPEKKDTLLIKVFTYIETED